ncbi:hypothetical protein AKJ46_00260 [candidate division MSBL1 archaeon SCGC-AAA833K04]|uniref:Uncharacterized protein n=1 Tax=candidate division MSBL1 archaeon SCGC-AAA833K04 TaxID=1698258 RepID=A0A133VSS6_9EURY|nr:hypothetical protein AKJ46_00260 [candidate division MSBL1 archaeon SCGC-AAA833K04]
MGEELEEEGFLAYANRRACWSHAGSSGWKRRIEREGLTLDFPRAWENVDRPEELKDGFEEIGISRSDVFERLRSFAITCAKRENY